MNWLMRSPKPLKMLVFFLACRLLVLLEAYLSWGRRSKKRNDGNSFMLNASLLSIIEEAGIAVLTLTEGLEKDEFLASCLTRAETLRQVKIMSDSTASIPLQTQGLLAEIDWSGWHTVARQIGNGDSAGEEALWFAVRSLTPATLMWLRVYRKNQPEIFEYKPAPAAGEAGA
jgi:uncharacterized protein with HEPN domain